MERYFSLKKGFIWITEWGVLWIFWMLFVSKWDPAEAWVGFVAAAISAVATLVVQKEPLVYFSPYWRWIFLAKSIPQYVVTGSWEALKAIGLQAFTEKGAPSILQHVPFDPGSEDAAS